MDQEAKSVPKGTYGPDDRQSKAVMGWLSPLNCCAGPNEDVPGNRRGCRFPGASSFVELRDPRRGLVRGRRCPVLAWDLPGRDRENRQCPERSRSHPGLSWWTIGGVKRVGSAYLLPYLQDRKLPACFEMVSLTGFQVGSGTTAVVAEFYLTDDAADQIDRVWRAGHAPELLHRRGARPIAQDGAWIAVRRTQAARRELHDTARAWMADHLPGAFASRDRRNPVFDMLLFEAYNPLASERPSLQRTDNLRALGITSEHLLVTSESLPGLLLHQTEPSMRPGLGEAACWTLLGSLAEIPESVLEGRGGDAPFAIAGHVNDVACPFFVSLGLSQLLKEIERSYAQLRDGARSQHRKLKGKYAEQLQEGLITLSLDISALARGVKNVHQYGWWSHEAKFTKATAPWTGDVPRMMDYNQVIAEEQLRDAADLLEADKDYRDVLTAVSALGASVDAFRVSRLALWVAAATLLLTAVILVVTDVGDHTLWHWLAERV